MSDQKEDSEKLKNELRLINELHKDLNETLDDLHELLRLSHDLRDSLKYSVGYFNQSTVKSKSKCIKMARSHESL